MAEVQFLGVVEHPNLVKLIGYCAVDGERGAQRLLVYEFMPNKTLDDHLFNKAYPPLPWNARLQVVLGAAEGLSYLHEGLEVQVRFWELGIFRYIPLQNYITYIFICPCFGKSEFLCMFHRNVSLLHIFACMRRDVYVKAPIMGGRSVLFFCLGWLGIIAIDKFRLFSID